MQELQTAKYLQQQEEVEQPTPKQVTRPKTASEKLNRVLGLTLCPIALILGVGWFLQSADEYVEDKKSALRNGINKRVARAQRANQRGIREAQQNAADVNRRFAEIGNKLRGR